MSIKNIKNEQTPASLPPVLSSFTNYRDYLKAFYIHKKELSKNSLRSYNYAQFSAAANIKSPNYLKLIIEGKRNLSIDMAHKFAKALSLKKDQTTEFVALIEYGQATDPTDRNQKLKKLNDMRMTQQMQSGKICSQAIEVVPNWVTWVVYTLADQKNVQFDVPALFKTMKGRASAEQIKRAMDRLFETGELVRDSETGEVKKGRALMVGNGSDPIPVELVRKLQSELIYLGLESLYNDMANEREFGAVTLALTQEEFEKVKFELRQLKKRIYTEVLVKREASKGDQVYQMNIQLFPVSEKNLDN